MPSVDPLIRIVCLIAFSVCVTVFAGYADLGLALFLILSAWVVRQRGPSSAAWRLLRRAKWLFMSLAVVYLAFVPGTPIFFGHVPGTPSVEGAQQALLRMGMLVALVFAVDIALLGLPPEQVLSAFYRLLKPLGAIGFSPEKVAVRGWLTLHYATTSVTQVVESKPPAQVNSPRVHLSQGVNRAAELVNLALTTKPDHLSPIRIELGAPTPWWQWALPIGVIILFGWISRI